MVDTKLLDKIKREVLVKNHIHYLHKKEIVEFMIQDGKIPITDKDLKEIVNNYIIQSNE